MRNERNVLLQCFLEKSILKMLDKLEPKKIVIVSSAPQIRFPDCYGIDMSKVFEFEFLILKIVSDFSLRISSLDFCKKTC